MIKNLTRISFVLSAAILGIQACSDSDSTPSSDLDGRTMSGVNLIRNSSNVITLHSQFPGDLAYQPEFTKQGIFTVQYRSGGMKTASFHGISSRPGEEYPTDHSDLQGLRSLTLCYTNLRNNWGIHIKGYEGLDGSVFENAPDVCDQIESVWGVGETEMLRGLNFLSYFQDNPYGSFQSLGVNLVEESHNVIRLEGTNVDDLIHSYHGDEVGRFAIKYRSGGALKETKIIGIAYGDQKMERKNYGPLKSLTLCFNNLRNNWGMIIMAMESRAGETFNNADSTCDENAQAWGPGELPLLRDLEFLNHFQGNPYGSFEAK